MALELTEEQIKTLKALAGAFFSHRECAIVLEIESSTFINAMKTPSSVAYKTYNGALLAAKLKIRNSILELAVRGSGPAQQQIIKIADATDAANR